MSRQLLRVCRSIPLSKLKQGGTLSIQSKFPDIRVHVIPEWRDDSLLTLTQLLPISGMEADMSVIHEADKMTSLGRAESHFSVHIFPKEPLQRNGAKKATVTSSPDSTSSSTKIDGMVITDDGEILPDSKEWHQSNVRRVDYSDGITHVSTRQEEAVLQEGQHEASLTLLAQIPEKCNLSCELQNGGHVHVDKKLEGNVRITTTDGNVRVHKLRGHDIFLSAQGTIVASNLLEAQRLEIHTQSRLYAKRIHGSQVRIKVESETDVATPSEEDVDDEGSLVDISALYVSRNGSADLNVTSTVPPEKRAVRIKSHHGHVAVQTSIPSRSSKEYPCVELGGVNGSFDVDIQNQNSSSFAGGVHVDSLSTDSMSFLSANAGNVSITLDRKVEADLRLLTSSEINTFEARSSLLQDDDPRHLSVALQKLDAKSVSNDESRIHITTDSFTARVDDNNDYQNIHYVDGYVENKSNEPGSRFDVKMGGKIRLEGASEQALDGFSASEDVVRPLVAISTNGSIELESLSWFGAIARRHGLDEKRDDLGRTASRSGRPLVPRE